MDHSIPSHDFLANYTDEETLHHHISQQSQSSSPISDSSFSDPCSPIWANSNLNSPEILEIPIPGQKAWELEVTQSYTLSSSTSPLGTPADGSSHWFSFYDNNESTGVIAAHSNSDRASTQLGLSSVSQSPSGWLPGVESHARSDFGTPSYYTTSQAAGPFPPQPEIQVVAHSATSLASPASSYSQTQPNNLNHTETKRTIDRGEGRGTPDPAEDGSLDAPYSHLIYEALINAPGKKLPLQGIYNWFEKNTTKGKDQNSKGWQNSIRHNLSMNAGFEAVKGESTNGKKTINYWRLTDEAIKKGIQSTTRYRKQANHKRSLGSDPPAPQRQRSGARGGKATKITAKYRGQMFMMTDQDDVQRERLRPHHPALLQQPPMDDYYPYLQTNASAATVSVPPTHVSGPATVVPRPSAEQCQYDLRSVIGCTEPPPCTPLFYDMAGPGAPYCLAYESGLGGWCGVHLNSIPNGLPHVNNGWLTGPEFSPDLKLSV